MMLVAVKTTYILFENVAYVEEREELKVQLSK